MANIRFSLLGSLRVWRGDTEVAISSDKQRTVLALLLLKAGTPVHRQEIIDAVWSEGVPDSVVNLVQTYVGRLRRRVDPSHVARSGASWLAGLGPAYAIRLDRCDTDLVRFRTAVARAGRAGSPRETLELLLRALQLWQGPCLSDLGHAVRGHPWVRAADQERVDVLLEAAKFALQTGLTCEVIPQLRAVAAAEPLNEAVHSWLVLALAGAGAQAEALAEYEATRRRLADELGIDPGPQLRAAHLQVLRQETGPASSYEPREPYELYESYEPAPSGGTFRPSLLPPDVADFTGREKTVGRLRGALTSRGTGSVAVALVTGQGGVGKTATALHVAHRLGEAFPDGQLHADMQGSGTCPADPSRVLARFLRALGVHASAVPHDLEERIDLYRSRLAGRRMLVVLDDVADHAQARPLLPGSPTCSVIVTSRSRLPGWPGAARFELEPLEPGEAADMLASVLGRERVAAEPEAAAEVARLCGRLPLALRAAGTRLAGRTHWTLARFAERLDRDGLDELALGDPDVRTGIAAGYHRLDEAARRAVRLLGVLDLPSFAPWTIAMALETSQEAAEELADSLTDARMLETTEPDAAGQTRYRFHELVRRYAREQAVLEESDTAVDVVVIRTLATFLTLAQEADERLPSARYTPVRGRAPRWPPPARVREKLLADPLAWFESERESLVAAVLQASARGLDELCWELAAAMLNDAALRSSWTGVERALRVALAACRRSGDRLGESVALRGLADARRREHRREGGEILVTALGGTEHPQGPAENDPPMARSTYA
ncbi:BTAD domain-containing putative transcriptional regulator [Streptosporangium sp. NPDC004379]|uniref:AfsR/SARP family transcriptional regulator n=1 Tax=Streptosporangium sp. NPDC004379 TaxID=3366189 RepID=UPI00367A871E